MTDNEQDTDARPEDRVPNRDDIVHALRLRPERLRIVRLSRKVLASCIAVALAAVRGAALWALQNNQKRETKSDELYSIDHNKVADGLAGLPKDYAGIPREAPRLGPPLPGDLGRPIVAAQAQSGPLAVDAEQQRVNQESEAARTSRIFAGTNARPSAATTHLGDVPASGAASSDEAFAQNGQDRKLAFVNASDDRRTTSQDRLVKPISPFVVQAGTIIPAALITGIRSDLPGQITAQVTENVYDSPTGRVRLIPQGARLIGLYDSQVAFGQSRVLLVWTRLIMPNGRSIGLERQQGADTGGFAGLEDEVDNHWGELFKAALLSTILGVGAQIGSGADSGTNTAILQALRLGAANSLNQTGQQAVRRNLSIQPTLTIRPGFPVRVIVNRDLALQPYQHAQP